jgi:hypothetical protein
VAISDLSTFDLTDEDLADRVSPEFLLLAPDSECLASGTDGVFDDSDRWTLTSASNDFESQGVSAGNLCKVELVVAPVAPRTSPTTRQIGLFAVASADGTSLTLRRLRKPAETGLPPGPVAGGSGYTFKVESLLPQLIDGADFVASRYSITDVSQIKAGTEGLCRRAAKLKAIINAYAAQSRNAGDEAKDDFTAQRKLYQAELDALLKILDPRYGIYPEQAGLQPGGLTATTLRVTRGRSCSDELGTPGSGCC